MWNKCRWLHECCKRVTSGCWPLWLGCIIDTSARIDFVSSILPLLGPWISWRLHLERAYIYLLLWSISNSISWRWKAMKQKIHLGRWSCTLQLDTFNFLGNNFCPALWLLGTHDAEKVKAKQSTLFWFYLKYLRLLVLLVIVWAWRQS